MKSTKNTVILRSQLRGQIEEYRMEDADFVILTSGSAVGTSRTVVDTSERGRESRIDQTAHVPSLPAGDN